MRDPQIGSFYQEDPNFSINSYVYVRNNPIILVDPSGKVEIVAYLRGGGTDPDGYEDGWSYKVNMITIEDAPKIFGKKGYDLIKAFKNGKWLQAMNILRTLGPDAIDKWNIMLRNYDLAEQMSANGVSIDRIHDSVVHEMTTAEVVDSFIGTDYDVQQWIYCARQRVRDGEVGGVDATIQLYLYDNNSHLDNSIEIRSGVIDYNVYYDLGIFDPSYVK